MPRSDLATVPPKDRPAQIREILALFHKWGVHTLGQLAALDKEELAARLGPEAARLWERATGRSTRLLKLIPPVESFQESVEFEQEVETMEPFLFILRRFLEQLSCRLNAIYHLAKEVTLQIRFSNRQSYERCFEIPQPTNQVDVLFRMLQTHLENFKSDHPIIAVSLQAQPAKPVAQQFRLFETALRDPRQLSDTLARLTGLLGADRVGTPVLEETYRPDAFQLEPFSWQLSDSLAVSESRSGPALRRLRSSLPALVLLDENRPIHLRSSGMSGRICARNGPYLASGNWWDEKGWRRSEWDLELVHGPLLRCHENAMGWQIDGIYD